MAKLLRKIVSVNGRLFAVDKEGGAGGGGVTVSGTPTSGQLAVFSGPTAIAASDDVSPVQVVKDFWYYPGDNELAALNYIQGELTSQSAGPAAGYGDFNALLALRATINPPEDDPDYNSYSALIAELIVPETFTKEFAYGAALQASLVYSGSSENADIKAITASIIAKTDTAGVVGIGLNVEAKADHGYVDAMAVYVELDANATADAMKGYYVQHDVKAGAHVIDASGFEASAYTDSGVIDNFYGFSVRAYNSAGTIGNFFHFYGSYVNQANNSYFLWNDSPGVFRVKGDGVMAYYNPSFTKYTPGAVDYERIVQQWNANVAEIGTEAGGTGTLRALRLLGPSVDATAYKVGGVAGIDFSGPVTNITVVKGIVTAAF